MLSHVVFLGSDKNSSETVAPHSDKTRTGPTLFRPRFLPLSAHVVVGELLTEATVASENEWSWCRSTDCFIARR